MKFDDYVKVSEQSNQMKTHNISHLVIRHSNYMINEKLKII